MRHPELLSAAALAAWLLAACWLDLRTRRIPNLLVASGTLVALAIHALAPTADGLFAFWWGGLGLGAALLGWLTGLLLFLPLYALRAVGAGDAKLMAMVGAWLGAKLVIGAALLSWLAGGVLAIVAMLATRSTARVLANVRTLLFAAATGLPTPGRMIPASRTRLPYAVAIAAGSLIEVAWLLAHRAP